MIIGKIFYIQFVEGAELKKKAKDAPMRVVEREVQRGNIYADDGVSILVTSVPYFEVRMDVASRRFLMNFLMQILIHCRENYPDYFVCNLQRNT